MEWHTQKKMCVTKHLAAMVRTGRYLKFLSRIVRQERCIVCACVFFFSSFAVHFLFSCHKNVCVSIRFSCVASITLISHCISVKFILFVSLFLLCRYFSFTSKAKQNKNAIYQNIYNDHLIMMAMTMWLAENS